MSLFVETNHGTYELECNDHDSVGSVLRRAGVPMGSVWTYVQEERIAGPDDPSRPAGRRGVRFVPSNTRIASLDRPVYARVSRNIAMPSLLGFEGRKIREVGTPSTEWTFPDGDAFQQIESQLTSDECFQIVRSSVDDVLAKLPVSDSPRVIVGTSGGGDSNVLLSAMLASDHLDPSNVVPTMMLGIPDWDLQLNSAQELCGKLGLQLHEIAGTEAARLAGVRSIDSVVARFANEYPDADLEFLGTFLLRRVLSAYAKEQGCSLVVTGANREDIVAEGLARIVRGKLPLPAPYRRIGDVTFVFPMWKVPKKIGDGAYVRYSLENYENRNPRFSPGRSIFYHVAYALPSIAAGFDITFLDGLAQLAKLESSPIEWDPIIEDHVVRESFDATQRRRWRSFLAGSS